MCVEAVTIDNCVDNVVTTLNEINEKYRKEDSEEIGVLGKAKPIVEFYRKIGRNLVRNSLKVIAKNWQSPECLLVATLIGYRFEAIVYERPDNAFLGLGAIGLAASSITRVIRTRLHYRGIVSGGVIEGRVVREEHGSALLFHSSK